MWIRLEIKKILKEICFTAYVVTLYYNKPFLFQAHIRRIVSIAWSLYLLGLYTSAERHDSLEKNIISAFYEQLLNAKVNLTKSLIQTAKTKRGNFIKCVH